MSPSESAAIDAVLIARGFRIIGNVSPDINGATPEEIAMLFPGDVRGAVRDMARLIMGSSVSVLPPLTTGHDDDAVASGAGAARGKVA